MGYCRFFVLKDGAKLKKNKLKGTQILFWGTKMSFWEDKNIFFGIFKDISPKTLVRPCPPRQLLVLQLPWKWKTTEVLQLPVLQARQDNCQGNGKRQKCYN
jgi:hypothetical protein